MHHPIPAADAIRISMAESMCMQVLVVPLPSAESHTFVMVKVTQELAARGHEVLVSPKYLYLHNL